MGIVSRPQGINVTRLSTLVYCPGFPFLFLMRMLFIRAKPRRVPLV
jgi:hypothetical protein